jgi:3-methyl-2-oxobutanoate hydroxymethyltransferase
MNSNLQAIIQKKGNHIPITIATAYDYPSARLVREAEIDILLVGDSVGTNVLGYESEQDVTMEDMVHHLRAVVRGAQGGCVMADLPFGAAPDPEQALSNSRRLIEAGAAIVKIEGWEERAGIIGHLTSNNVAVCAHIGYNPQQHGPRGRVFGRESAVAVELVNSALALEKAGAVMVVAEKIPEEVTQLIATRCTMPVIGIGSGRYCDGQVLVFHDIVGYAWRGFRHARMWAHLREDAAAALTSYKNDVVTGVFPGTEHASHIADTELETVRRLLGEG